MSRNKPPTTMSPPYLVRETLHSVKTLNEVARQERAGRLVAKYLDDHPDQRMDVAEMLAKGRDNFAVARELSLVEDPVVTQRRRLRSTLRC